jgi:transposase-like protein
MSIKCQHCEEGTLVVVTAYEPWNLEHYQCEDCDSTYSLGDVVNTERFGE